MKQYLINKYRSIKQKNLQKEKAKRIKNYLDGGQEPWALGYNEFKVDFISEVLQDSSQIAIFANNQVPKDYGYRLDERVVELPWSISHLSDKNTRLLDAGSGLNFEFLVQHPKVAPKDLTIFTYAPENNNFNTQRISYVYGDLRTLPFKDGYFEEIVSISTIEHIDMNNELYGWNANNTAIDCQEKSYDYLKALQEMVRVLAADGSLLLTFPYGKFENHGFFQQFDHEMLERALKVFMEFGQCKTTFFRYDKSSWVVSNAEECAHVKAYNPHTGKGKGNDGAAHCRSICTIHFTKSIN